MLPPLGRSGSSTPSGTTTWTTLAAFTASARSSPTRHGTRAGSPRSPVTCAGGRAERAGAEPFGQPVGDVAREHLSGRVGAREHRLVVEVAVGQLGHDGAQLLGRRGRCRPGSRRRRGSRRGTSRRRRTSRRAAAGRGRRPRRVKLCATIMWSRTVTPNTAPPRCRRSTRGTAPAARGETSRGITSGRVSNGDSPVSRLSNAGSRRRSRASVSRSAVVRRPRRAGATMPTWLALTDEPTRVEAAPERELVVVVAVPAELDDRALRRQQLQRPLQARGGRAGVEDQVAPVGRLVGQGEVHPSAAATSARVGSTSTSVTGRRGSRVSSRARQQPTVPAPTTATRSPTSGAASQSALTAVSTMPASTARGTGTSSGTTVTADAGTTYAVWCGCRQNTVRPRRCAGPSSTTPDVEVAVLHRPGEVAVLKGRPHRVVLARRHVAAEDEALGPPADSGPESSDSNILRAAAVRESYGRISPTPGSRSQNASASLSIRPPQLLRSEPEDPLARSMYVKLPARPCERSSRACGSTPTRLGVGRRSDRRC